MRCAVVIQVHSTVELSIEGSGVPLKKKIGLINNKLHVGAVKELLDSQRMRLVSINGTFPVPDGDGFTFETYSPNDTVTIEAAPKAGV